MAPGLTELFSVFPKRWKQTDMSLVGFPKSSPETGTCMQVVYFAADPRVQEGKVVGSMTGEERKSMKHAPVSGHCDSRLLGIF